MGQKSAGRVLMAVNTHVYDDPRVLLEGGSLAEAGYEVQVIGAARHPDGGLPVRGQKAGMHIILVPMTTGRNLLKLLAAFWQIIRGNTGGETTDPPPSRYTSLVSILFFNFWVLRLGLGKKADVLHCHDLSPLPAMWILARLKRARLIYDSHENHAHLYTGRKGQVVTRLEKMLIKKPDVIITPGQLLADALYERGAKRVVVVGHWKRLEEYQPDPERLETLRDELQLPETGLKLVYIGMLNGQRHVEELVKAVTLSPDVSLIIGGTGIEETIVETAAAQHANIRWLGWVNSDDVPAYTNLADVVCYILNPEKCLQAHTSTPNKLFEAFAAGKALIGKRGYGELGRILEDIPAGVLLDEVTPETIQQAFTTLKDPDQLAAMQQASSDAGQVYNWSVAEERLQAIYSELAPSRRP